MGASVLQLALRVQSGERDVGVDCPVLVWEAQRVAETAEAPLATQAMRFAAGRPEAGQAVYFEVRKRDDARNAFAMGITLGRAETNDVPIDDGSVSRFHAWLQQDARTGQWRLVDADSKNGTWVGPLKLASSRPEVLADGARIRLGSVELRFLQPASFLGYLDGYRRR
ncbi:MAG: FHA domain-containing protein [Myxococcaceae bacterium]|nr:FHA domain-containing protein [Myxococcaceae bacterium]